MAESGSRFAHFLQPIRDLSKVWKIEIADELERYIEEVAQLTILNPIDGVTKLNFAEAALLIQGSTSVYSRKVELLHQLVYQALDLLCTGKGLDGRGPKGKATQTGLWAPLPDSEALITIDHLIKEARGTSAVREEVSGQREATQRRVPLFLMPRDQADRRNIEFRMSACAVHRTGALLIQESDALLLEDILGSPALQAGLDQPLVSAPPYKEVHELEERLREALQELPGDPGSVARPPVGAGALVLGSEARPVVGARAMVLQDDASRHTPALQDRGADATALCGETQPLPPSAEHASEPPGAEQQDRRSVEAARAAAAAAPDPWAPLDEHDANGRQNPLEVGRTEKRTSGKHLLACVDSMPDSQAWEPLPDGELWHGCAAALAAPILAAGHPVESLFLAVAGKMQASGRYEAQRAGFSAAWLEIEDLIAASVAARRALRRELRKNAPALAGAPDEACGPDEDAEAESEREVDAAQEDAEAEEILEAKQNGSSIPREAWGQEVKGSELDEAAGDDATLALTPRRPSAERGEGGRCSDEHRREVSRLESMIEDAQHSYEVTVRNRLQRMHKEHSDADAKSMPQLYANVRKWSEQLEPVLKEYDQRTDFNIHSYSNTLLKKLKDLENRFAGDGGSAVPFASLVNGQPHWEVCRRFLTTLFLTNLGNTDIVYGTEEEKLNRFGVKLLIAEKKMIHLEAENEPQPEDAKPSKVRRTEGKPAAKCASQLEDEAPPAAAKLGKAARKQGKPVAACEGENTPAAAPPKRRRITKE